MRYPIVIDKDPGSAYCMIVPDLPGCYTWADTVEEVLIQAVEAIKCHLSGMLTDGDAIPEPMDIAFHQNDPEFDCFQRWDWVTVTLPELRHYPVLIYRKRRKHYRLIASDLPGCVVRGKTALEALAKAGLAIERYMEARVLKDETIPEPQPLAYHRDNPAHPAGQWDSVPIIVPEIEHLRIARPGRIPRFFRWFGFTRFPWEARPRPRIRGARPPEWEEVDTQTKAAALKTTQRFAQTD